MVQKTMTLVAEIEQTTARERLLLSHLIQLRGVRLSLQRSVCLERSPMPCGAARPKSRAHGLYGIAEVHCHRLANYATGMGRALGLAGADLDALHRRGFLHDIGMLAIPPSALLKAGPLEPDEYERVKSHTIIGDDGVGTCGRSRRFVRSSVTIMNGATDRAIPTGLRGDEIPLLAQIISVVDRGCPSRC